MVIVSARIASALLIRIPFSGIDFAYATLPPSRSGSSAATGNVDVHGVELRRVDPPSRRVDVGAVESLHAGDLAARQRKNRSAVEDYVESLALQRVDGVLGISESVWRRDGRAGSCHRGGCECAKNSNRDDQCLRHVRN